MDLAEIKKSWTEEFELPNHIVDWLIAEVERLSSKCEERRNMLEDVINELDLSDGMVEQHGPLGTAPATLVRLVLERKDREIAMLKAGMVPIGHSSLTFSRAEGKREGLEEGAKALDKVKEYCEQKSLYAELAAADIAWQQAAYEAELAAAAIREAAQPKEGE